MITIHVVIAGFTQTRNRWHGMLALYEQMLAERGHDGLVTRVWFQRWYDDWRNIAEHAWLIGDHHKQRVQACVYAYSWGAGWGAMRFAHYLDRNGIKVGVMVLSDPVYRHPLFNGVPLLQYVGQWRAMFPGSAKIKVPPNVGEVFCYFQRKNRPSGHDLVAVGDTKIHECVQLDVVHEKMDDDNTFHKMALKKAREFSEAA